MALILQLRRDQYIRGTVNLYQGDRWTLDATVMNRIGNVDIPFDLSGASGITGYFPSASGGPDVPVAGNILDAKCGMVSVIVLEAMTPNLGIPSNPTVWYSVVQMSDGSLETLVTLDQPLVISARNILSLM